MVVLASRAAAALALGALLLWGAWWHLIAFVILERNTHFDFGRFYYSIKLWLAGGSLYGPSYSTWLQLANDGIHLWNLNPPHVALLFWPLASLTLEQGFVVWTALNAFALIFALQWALDACGVSVASIPVWRRWAWCALAIGSAPTLAWIGTGQLTGVLTLVITCAWIAARQQRWTQAGLWVGLGVASKPFLAPLVLLLLLRRQWRAALAAAIGASACFLLGLAVFGWSEHLAWIRSLADVQWPWLTINSSLSAPLARYAYAVGGHATNAAGLPDAARIGMILGIGVIATSLVVAARSPDADRSWLLVIVASLLASPLGWLYYWWVAVGPLIADWKSVRRYFWCALPGLLAPMYWIGPYVASGTPIWSVGIGSVYTWALLVLWTGVLYATIHSSRRRSSPRAELSSPVSASSPARALPDGTGRAITPRRARYIWAAILVYSAGVVALAAAGVYVFVVKTLIWPLLIALGVQLAGHRAFVRDWAVPFGVIALFDAARGLIYAVIMAAQLPIYLDYAIKWEQSWFGAILPVGAQNSLRHAWLDSAAVVVHASHFTFFLAFGFVVWWTNRGQFQRWTRGLYLVLFIGLVAYLLVPTVPPWMAGLPSFGAMPQVDRTIIATYTHALPVLFDGFNTNPVAAMPSLHVALPAYCAFVGSTIAGRGVGALLWTYTAAVVFSVIYLGEHYGVDVFAGLILSAIAFQIGFRGSWRCAASTRPYSLAAGALCAAVAFALMTAYLGGGPSAHP